MNRPINKAVFPVAGLGSRFLPVTKAIPKEMLPVIDKPLIQYAVEEAISAGIENLIFVTSSCKRAIEDHFDMNFELEAKLARAGREDLLDIVHNILPKGINCFYLRQHDTLGLGHAVLCAKPLIGDEPFAVLLADDLIDGENESCLQQMVSCYQRVHHSIIATEEIPITETLKYGIVKLASVENRLGEIQKIVEKPQPEHAPSNLGVVGRYILTPAIFSCLENTTPGRGGEIQLTDGIAKLLQTESVSSYSFKGRRYDCGSKQGYLQATVAQACKDPELALELKSHFQTLFIS